MKSVNIYVKSRKRISTCLSHLFQIVCNLCPGWLICLMRKKGFCSLLTSLILGLYYKLNWPKRASAVYWLLGTLLYSCIHPCIVQCVSRNPCLVSGHTLLSDGYYIHQSTSFSPPSSPSPVSLPQQIIFTPSPTINCI